MARWLSKKKNGHRKFWQLGREEVNTAHFDVTPEGTLLVREGNYQYNIYDIIKKHGTPTEIFFPTIVENRVRDLRWPDTYVGVITQPLQFTAFNAEDPNALLFPAESDATWADCVAAADLVIAKVFASIKVPAKRQSSAARV